jgi:hypothetical protein
MQFTYDNKHLIGYTIVWPGDLDGCCSVEMMLPHAFRSYKIRTQTKKESIQKCRSKCCVSTLLVIRFCTSVVFYIDTY